MTKKLLTAMLMLAVMSSAARSAVLIDGAAFPDEVFREYVSQFDGDGDVVLSDEELAAVDGIHVQESGISSLKGIEYFTNITQLNCQDNNLTELDVSKCTRLEYLWCARNQLTSLNINGCNNLVEINCQENSLTGTLDLSNRTALRDIHCRLNDLTSLVVDGCYALENVNCRNNRLTGTLDLSSLRNLVEVNCRSNNLTGLNITGCDSLEILNCHTNADDGPEHTNHISVLDLRGKNRLQELTCTRNSLTALDLSDCTALVSLDCCINQIQELDFSHSPNLRQIECWNNRLSSVNVSANTRLEWADFGSNDIKTLDVSHNTALKHLEAYDCRLSEIDVSHNTELDYLELGGANDEYTERHNRLTAIDVSANTKLTYLAVDRNLLTELDVSMLPSLEILLFHVNPITDIDLSHNPALYELYCRDTALTSLDLSANPALTILRCQNNDITTLDLSANPHISALSCDMNDIHSLTVSESGIAQYPYQTDMKTYAGDSYTRITSITAYGTDGTQIASSFTPASSNTALFAAYPSRVVYLYDLGYTGSADITRTMRVTLSVPDDSRLPSGIIQPPEVAHDVLEKVASTVSLDVRELRTLTYREIETPQEPTQDMQNYVKAENSEIIGKLNVISVDADGWYVFRVELTDELYELLKDKNISDFKFYGLNDSDTPETSSSFIIGLVNTWEVLTLSGEKMDTFGVREFLMVGFLNAGRPLSMYIAKILLMLLAGGCEAGLGISSLIALAVFLKLRRH